MIDRYNCEYCNIIGENDMCESKDGEWVRYEDIKHLLQNTSSNSDYAKCRKEIMEYFDDHLVWKDCEVEGILKKHFA